ncbi:MAG TPA: outer membrane beta-barrel protein [Fimbriimonadaceae bacterium]|jgi:hypothetical protein
MYSALLGVIALAAGQNSAPTATPKDTPFTFGGYLDFYYMYDSGQPHLDLNDRWFDVKNNCPTLAEADLDILKAPSARVPIGVTINLIAGRSADVLHGTEPGGVHPYEYIGQAFLTYATPGKRSLTINAGQFYTWIGYEGLDSRTQDNYSRSFDFTLMEPDYHLGVNASYALSPKLTGTVYLVNGWNEDVESHNGKSWGLQLAYAASDKLNISIQNYSGPEGSDRTNPAGTYGGIGFPNPGTHFVNLLDVFATYQAHPDLKFVACLDYASAAGPGGGTWDGEAVYMKKQLNGLSSGTLRLERAGDNSGLRTGTPVTLWSATATYDLGWKNFKYLLSRFEIREDFAGASTFVSSSGPRRQRTTFTVAEVLHF